MSNTPGPARMTQVIGTNSPGAAGGTLGTDTFHETIHC